MRTTRPRRAATTAAARFIGHPPPGWRARPRRGRRASRRPYPRRCRPARRARAVLRGRPARSPRRR
ncbi:hypothetical protein DMH03_17805 [Amycolatopsis sp. WAC 01376]|nr:hypothetical protein DMH03_17805 [Amycolatopsis sp. WAC 01376]